MKHTGSFLDKYKKITPPHGVVRDAVCEAINAHLEVRLSKGSVRVHNKTVHITASPALKNTIMIRRQELLEELQRTLGNGSPRDIR